MPTPLEITNNIIVVLKTIYDPEIPVNIYDMGLVYDVKVDEKNDAKILLTLTAPNCPEAEVLPAIVHDTVVEKVKELKSLTVNITFEPMWTPDKMSPEARIALDMM